MAEILDTLKSVWDKSLIDLKSQVSDQTFSVWFDPIKPLQLNDTSMTLGVPNEFFKEWLSERYIPLIKSSVSHAYGKSIDILFSVTKSTDSAEPTLIKETLSKEKKGLFRALFPKQPSSLQANYTGVNARYTFDSFVIGPSNRFAH
ncbi:MAG: DnaA N-terminal domain-containing protein, partial [Candidatus Omnitrophica bacterium]|nr:DnaA N-terminal domain-containing protein [Candidatus Omnitrophota bacterium]